MRKIDGPAPLATEDLYAAACMQALAFFEPPTCPFAPLESTLEFATHYGLKIDGDAYNLDRFSHLLDLYEDECNWIAVMAAAQSGKSAWVMADLARAGVSRWGANLGYYFPDNHLPRAFSRGRFAPMIRSSADLGAWLGRGTADKDNVDQIQARAFGASVFYFLSVRGISATEGLPMGGIWLDEVRRMAEGDIQRAEERCSAQERPLYRYVSTARFLDSDIHRYFRRGDQRFFHSECACPDGIVLSRTWPDCIADLSDTPDSLRAAEHAFAHAGRPFGGMAQDQRDDWGDVVYRCPKCGTVIVDPRVGWWEPDAPEIRGRHSYQLPQLLNPVWPAARVWAFWNQPGIDLQEFHNSKLGLPHMDAEAVPVQIDHLLASVDPSLLWPARQSAEWRRERCKNTAMGVDVQRGYLVAVVKARLASGKYGTIHVEVVHVDRGAGDPWKQLARLMVYYDVRLAVIDSAPEWNEARRFALTFKGRVFLAQYVDSDTGGDMIAWQDAGDKRSQRGDGRFRYLVNIQRTRGFQWSLGMWKMGGKALPPPDELVQHLPVQSGEPILAANLAGSTWAAVRIVRALYWLHLMRVAIIRQYPQDDPDGRTGRFKLRAEHVGLDPHFAHADLYADVALSRVAGPLLTP